MGGKYSYGSYATALRVLQKNEPEYKKVSCGLYKRDRDYTPIEELVNSNETGVVKTVINNIKKDCLNSIRRNLSAVDLLKLTETELDNLDELNKLNKLYKIIEEM